jgi:hypothetical protein
MNNSVRFKGNAIQTSEGWYYEFEVIFSNEDVTRYSSRPTFPFFPSKEEAINHMKAVITETMEKVMPGHTQINQTSETLH